MMKIFLCKHNHCSHRIYMISGAFFGCPAVLTVCDCIHILMVWEKYFGFFLNTHTHSLVHIHCNFNLSSAGRASTHPSLFILKPIFQALPTCFSAIGSFLRNTQHLSPSFFSIRKKKKEKRLASTLGSINNSRPIGCVVKTAPLLDNLRR